VKIGILSDIHVDINYRSDDSVVGDLSAAIVNNRLDRMIIAGDVASDYELTLLTLRDIETASGVPCLFVPGNHDVWNEKHPSMTAWEIYDHLKTFPGNLANGPQPLGENWTAIGDLGWYDYAFGDPEFSTEDFDRMKIDDRLWQDKIMAVWDRPTQEMHRYFLAKLETQLENNRRRHVILVLHVLPIRFFTVQSPDRMWRYLNAFLGSPAYGELALKYDVRYVICGHVHYRRQTRINQTTFICNCLNYRNQWYKENPAEEIADTLKVIEID
jgi:putative phosphoesterase